MPPGEQFKRFFPGLIRIEQRLWREWLVEHETDFVEFEYNVRVGEGLRFAARALDGDPVLQAKMMEQFRQATQKKIDVVGFKGEETWIFEVEERPGPRALGQLLTYQTLLPKALPIIGPIQLSLIARRLGPDMLEVFEGQGVFVFQVDLPER